MTANKWRPRLSVDIDGTLHTKLKELVPHGLMGKVITAIVEDLVDLLEEDASFVIGAVLSREMSVKKILRFEEELKEDPPEGTRYKLPYVVRVLKRVYKKDASFGRVPTKQDYMKALDKWFEEGELPKKVE